MTPRAKVTSVEAIASFRSSLIVYTGKARASVEEAGEEIKRTRSWLLDERRSHWEKEILRRRKQLEEAEQELFTARLGKLRAETAAQVAAVQRARRACREAEEKREAVRRWNREFENRVQPLIRQVDQLHTFLTSDISKAAAQLENVLRALELYASTKPGAGNPLPGAQGAGAGAAAGQGEAQEEPAAQSHPGRSNAEAGE
jgi:hypothetical protein